MKLARLLFLVVALSGCRASKNFKTYQAEAMAQSVYTAWAQGQLDEGLRWAEKAVDFTLKEFGPDHSRTASAYTNLGAANFHLGRYAEAEQALLQGLAIWENTENPDPFLVATALINLAEIYKAQGRLDAAEIIYRRAVTLLESTPTSDPWQLTLVRYNLSEILRMTERCALAEPIYGEILEDTEHAADRQVRSLYGMSLNGLGICLHERESYAEAGEQYRKACKVMAETLGPNDPNTVVCLQNLSDLDQEIAAGEETAAEGLPATSPLNEPGSPAPE